MTRVRFLRGTALGGIGNDAHPGDVRDLPEWQAANYITTGRAVIAPEPAVVPPAPTFDAPAATPRKKGK